MGEIRQDPAGKSLANELGTFYNQFHSDLPPEASSIIKSATSDAKQTFDPSTAIQIGARFPDFVLPDATGQEVSSADLLRHGPMLVSFYRGEWCPFCNIELRALQKYLPQFKAKGVTLVTISPELPDQTLSVTEKHSLEFPVLSDVGNKLARQLGIVVRQADGMRTIFEMSSIDWQARYGDDSLEVPVPATMLVDEEGVVRNTFLDANFHRRLEPETALQWIDDLQK